MDKYVNIENIDYTLCSIYWGKERGKDLYRQALVAFSSDIEEMATEDVIPRATHETEIEEWTENAIRNERRWEEKFNKMYEQLKQMTDLVKHQEDLIADYKKQIVELTEKLKKEND